MFKLPDLPYAKDALAPVMSEIQLTIHHDKHHARYVDTLNGFLKDAGAAPSSIEEVVKTTSGDAARKKWFNNAAQAWNHAFFWECLTPSYVAPSGELAAAIDKTFGSLDGLRTKFVDEGAGHFGSGWAWLVARGAELSVVSTHDAATPIVEDGVTAILTSDVWEHAYYLDYKNDRKAFLEAFFDKLANWTFAESQYAAAVSGGASWAYPAPT
jgi:superoxide dismutase, Fe-Mn family